MERLTIRDKNGEAHMICKQMCGDYGHQCDGQIDVDMCQRYVAFDKLAEYEDLEEQGFLLKLPCKVGDTVYQIDAERVYESEVKWIIFDCDDIAFDERAIGGSIFLTREEAEAALKGGDG